MPGTVWGTGGEEVKTPPHHHEADVIVRPKLKTWEN